MTVSVHHHRVRSYEVDHQGFLFNGRFLEIADAAMAEFFRSLGFDYPGMIAVGFDPAIVATELQFATPGRLDDILTVRTVCDKVGTTSVVLVFTIARTDLLTGESAEMVATIRTTYVNVDAASAASTPIPDPVRQRLLHATSSKEHR